MASSAASATLAIPSSLSPLPAERIELLERLLSGLDSHSLYWISGYVAAAAQAQLRDGSSASYTSAAPSIQEVPVSILYGSQTGNAAKIASNLHQQLQAQNVPARLIRADRYSLKELRNEKQLYVVISTQGDGDPPEDSRAFVEQLLSPRAPKLDQLSFSVLALGDSSYPKFCSVGKAIDARLAELGAQRLIDRADADVEIELVSEPWLAQTKAAALKFAAATRPSASVLALPRRPSAAPITFSAEHPYLAPVLAAQRITTKASSRDIRHLELGFEAGTLRYEPGDALGVLVENPPTTVHEILQQLNQSGDSAVSVKGSASTLITALSQSKEITRVSKAFVQALAQRVGPSDRAELEQLLGTSGAAQLSSYLADWQLLDFLQRYPSSWQAQDLIDALRPLKPRLYSIASSMRSVGEEVHLCVAHIAYQHNDQARFGAGSHYLAGTEPGQSLRAFVESNERFRLPADPSRDVIMIGPGTGVAPFRAFVQERQEAGASGRNWLFFGNPNFRHDFLYQLEWQQALKDKHLTRLDLAFSRDQAEKIYLQQRLREQAKELYQWLDNGAHLYVCGDATRMAKDVEKALLEVIGSQSGKSPDQAREYLMELSQSQRYQRDIY